MLRLGGMLGGGGRPFGRQTLQSRRGTVDRPAGTAGVATHATCNELPVAKAAYRRKHEHARGQPALSRSRDVPGTSLSLHSNIRVDSFCMSGVIAAPATTDTRISMANWFAPLKRRTR
jgi:hypothetical protein